MSFIFLYGRPGTGKTTLTTTLIKLGHKIRLIDVDHKAEDMQNIKHFVEDGSLIIQPILSPLVDTTLKNRVSRIVVKGNSFSLPPPDKQPKGYNEFVDIIDNLSALHVEGKPDPDDCTVLVAPDSLTTLLEHLKRHLLYVTRQGKFERDHWGAWLSNLEEIFHTLQSLQGMYKHVIITAHEMTERDEDTGRILGIYPLIEGSMRYKVGDYFNEIYHTFVAVDKNGAAKYSLETRSLNKAEARTSRALNSVEVSDFETLFKEEVKQPAVQRGVRR